MVFKVMKRTKRIIFSLGVLTFILVSGSMAYGEGPSIKALGQPWDFGKIERGKVTEKTFNITNSGGGKLVIKEIKVCCGYMVSDVSKWEILPGEKALIKISADPSGKEKGRDERFITVISNDEGKSSYKIPVVSYVKGDKKLIIPSVNAKKLNEFLENREKIAIIDVREESEFKEKHIKGARNFPRSTLVSFGKIPPKLKRAVRNKDIVVVYCGGGFRSSFIARKLTENGYNAFNLDKGLKGWEKEGFNVVKGPKSPKSLEPLQIGTQEAYEHYYELFRDNVIWVDVRSKSSYEKGHIKGARNIELHLFEEEIQNLPKNKEIVLYCDGEECDESYAAGKMLTKNGFKQAKTKVLIEGFKAWQEAGYPVKEGSST